MVREHQLLKGSDASDGRAEEAGGMQGVTHTWRGGELGEERAEVMKKIAGKGKIGEETGMVNEPETSGGEAFRAVQRGKG